MSRQDYEQLTLFPEDSLASRFPLPGSEKAKMMTVSSGLKCSELYGNSGRLGSLVKMCLESLIWHSTRCLLTWKTKDTKHRHLLFQLAVSMPPTEETESLLWPTPKASAILGGCSGARKTLAKMAEKGLITEQERRMFSSGNGGQINPQLIEWLMGYEQKFTELLPTPRTSIANGAPKNRWYSQTVQVEREREENGVSGKSGRTHRINSAWEDWPNEPELDRVVDGIPNRVDRLKCLGNAVVPQQFYPFFSFIAEIENNKGVNE